MGRHAGRTGRILLSTTTAGAPAELKHVKDWNVNEKAAKSDVSGMDDTTNKVKVKELPDVTGAFSFWWDDLDDAVYQASRAGEPVVLVQYPSTEAADKWGSGLVEIDFSMKGSMTGGVEGSAEWEAAGPWNWTL